jgi:hypothetical protein
MKFPTIMLGIPHLSRRMVKEKQQLMKPSSIGSCSSSLLRTADDVLAPGVLSVIANRSKKWDHEYEGAYAPAGVALLMTGLAALEFNTGLYLSTHDVRTAF